ncbi:hypothetical protein N7462_010453 [Penicillium macrosclerotiorum]|uniref:uncharacterized protein n=1 Tax=Penicillium macrosclerotiorum TaxID=303699 RepID=UPI0025479FE4|nr:uncharacterized protein N7462_010453 [Penicillium macrosclerotiorum]KAJ5669383.1 hypothetical protein N7462_010453 [Penicillium macrosclerotiorum]
MERLRKLLARPAEYEPLAASAEHGRTEAENEEQRPFSMLEYTVFFLLGVAMLWAWNMFLAAAPYFHSRFESNEWTAKHYQPSILSVSTVTNLGTVYVLARVQKDASYSWRIILSLLVNCFVFTLLAFSTVILESISVRAYFGFLMVMVFGASFATGLIQNGVFAFVSGFGREEYTQAIMGGQGVAGVLPCIVQIVSVLALSDHSGDNDDDSQRRPQSSSKSAFVYFLTATGVSVLTLLAFLYLLRKQPILKPKYSEEDEDTALINPTHDKAVSLWTLYRKLRFLALSVFGCFLITMVLFPVYTSVIQSVNYPGGSRIYEPAVFIPLAFLVWNVGDLCGRIAVASPKASLAHRPGLAYLLAIGRVGFVPLYLLCNIRGEGAVVQSDFFYLFIVQFFFGVTNGYLASSCMMGASHWVSPDEREAAGGFMSMMLVGGLAAGSLLSFLVAN